MRVKMATTRDLKGAKGIVTRTRWDRLGGAVKREARRFQRRWLKRADSETEATLDAGKRHAGWLIG